MAMGLGVGLWGVQLYAALAAAAEASAPAYGATAGFDNGTEADRYVNPATGNDSWDGTSPTFVSGTTGPMATTQAAANDLDGVSGALSIAVIASEAAPVRESLDLDGLTFPGGLTIRGYGTARGWMAGGEALGAGTQCSASDTILNGVDDEANVYKWTITKPADVPIEALNIVENGVQLALATDLATPPDDKRFFLDDTLLYSTTYNLDGSGFITSMTDATVFSGLTSAQVTNAWMLVYGSPFASNFIQTCQIASFASNVATLTNTATYKPHASGHKAGLANALWNLTAGTYGVLDNGDGTVTIYAYLNDSANAASGQCEYAARDHIVDLGDCDDVTFEGMGFRHTGGAGNNSGILIGHHTKGFVSGAFRHSNIAVNECELKHVFSWGEGTDGEAYGLIDIGSTDGVSITNNTLADAPNGELLHLTKVTDATVTDNDLRRCDHSGFSLYGDGTAAGAGEPTENVRVAYNLWIDCGLAVHANPMVAYSQVDRLLFYGNDVRCPGYVTFQQASDLYYGCNKFAPARDGRALVDQNDGTAPPDAAAGRFAAWNNTVLPTSGDLTLSSSIQIGDGTTPQTRYLVANNLAHGLSLVSIADTLPIRKRNVWTINTQGKAGNGDTVTTHGATYADAANDDFDLVADGPAGATGYDMTNELVAIQALFPTFDFTKDGYKQTIDWSAPFVGWRDPGFAYASESLESAAWMQFDGDVHLEFAGLSAAPSTSNEMVGCITFRLAAADMGADTYLMTCTMTGSPFASQFISVTADSLNRIDLDIEDDNAGAWQTRLTASSIAQDTPYAVIWRFDTATGGLQTRMYNLNTCALVSATDTATTADDLIPGSIAALAIGGTTAGGGRLNGRMERVMLWTDVDAAMDSELVELFVDLKTSSAAILPDMGVAVDRLGAPDIAMRGTDLASAAPANDAYADGGTPAVEGSGAIVAAA